MTKTRLEAFSDGVIAIIITIMVLEIKRPEAATFEALKHILPPLLCYVFSFIVVGIYWGNHHHLIHTISSINSKIMWSNMHLLFWLSLIPVATDWTGETGFAPIPLLIYSLLLAMCGIAYTILLYYISQAHPHNKNLEITLKRQKKKGLISFVIYLIAAPLAFVSPVITCTMVASITFLWYMPDKDIERNIKE
jgi:uncharacterized membrane protein